MRETLRAARLPSGKPTEADKPRLVTFPDTPAAREAKRNPQDERLW